MCSQTTHPTFAVLPPTTPPSHHERRTQLCTQEHRKARRIVRNNIDTIDHRPDDRVMQKTSWHRICQCAEESADHGRDDGSCAQKTSVTSSTVLAIADISISAVNRELTHAAALGSSNGITLNVFDSLAYLPHYSETLENHRLPRPVAALRIAAIEAHAAMVLTDYYGHIPATVHNAIDWLTRRWNRSALHDKPLAVIGPTENGYSGVWSRHQTEASRPTAGTLVIEPITVATLHDAVRKLTEQAKDNQPACRRSQTPRRSVHRGSAWKASGRRPQRMV
jgi:NAD(P)H-dependent FMN reductase